MEFLLALQFLTRIPVKIKGKVEQINLARSMVFYPVIGLLIGLFSGGIYFLTGFFLPPQLCDLSIIAAILIVTGNIHLDGLMDTADGIFSGKPRDRMLEIMKDSRIGSHGLAAGVLILLGRFILLNDLGSDMKIEALIAAPVLGRLVQVLCAWKYSYARETPGTGSFTKHVGKREILIATGSALIIMISLLYPSFTDLDVLARSSVLITKGSYLILSGLFLYGITRYIVNKLGGLTGDTYGAMSELTEIFVLMAFLVK